MARSIPYGRQNITQADLDAVKDVLVSDFLTQGPAVASFETAFSKYVNAKHSVAVSNGTVALHLACLALGLEKGDRIITTPITFAASGNAALYCGAEVYFVDIDPETFVMDLDKLKNLLSSKPKGYFKGVIPVDFTGYPVNTEKLKHIVDSYDMWILKDACHAPGAYFTDSNGEKVFSGQNKYADLTIFSFHPVKHIACGEGGMITANDDKLFEDLSLLRTHGITRTDLEYSAYSEESQGAWYYEMQSLGYNCRLTDMQAALGESQLNRAEEGVARRNEIAAYYRDNLVGVPMIQHKKDDSLNAHHLYVIQTEKRKDLYDFLRTKQIYTQVHYIPLHLMPFYSQFGWKKGDFPNAESYYDQCLSLPMYPSITDEELAYVVEQIKLFYS